MKKVLIWDFDGTLGYRDGWWRGCLTDVLQSVDSSISVTPEEISVFLQEGFPWHNPNQLTSGGKPLSHFLYVHTKVSVLMRLNLNIAHLA